MKILSLNEFVNEMKFEQWQRKGASDRPNWAAEGFGKFLAEKGISVVIYMSYQGGIFIHVDDKEIDNVKALYKDEYKNTKYNFFKDLDDDELQIVSNKTNRPERSECLYPRADEAAYGRKLWEIFSKAMSLKYKDNISFDNRGKTWKMYFRDENNERVYIEKEKNWGSLSDQISFKDSSVSARGRGTAMTHFGEHFFDSYLGKGFWKQKVVPKILPTDWKNF